MSEWNKAMCAEMNQGASIAIYPKGCYDDIQDQDLYKLCLFIKFHFLHDNVKQYRRSVDIELLPKSLCDEVDGRYHWDENVYLGFESACAYWKEYFQVDRIYKYDEITFVIDIEISDVEYNENELFVTHCARIA